jgi:tRNA threonylcarbamoyl adenosine modification protein YeaZ
MAEASSSPLVLALDTSIVVAVAVARGQAPLAAATIDDPRAHVEQLTPLIASVCREAGVRAGEIDQIVVGVGPGPFTGLRVGIITARMLAEITGAELHGVCGLDAIAGQHTTDTEFVVATDARRREVYWARYASDGNRLVGPSVSAPAEVPRLPTVGPAADLYPEALAVAPGPRALDAAGLAVRGPSLPSAGFSPLYLRRPDANEVIRRKSVLARPRSRRG